MAATLSYLGSGMKHHHCFLLFLDSSVRVFVFFFLPDFSPSDVSLNNIALLLGMDGATRGIRMMKQALAPDLLKQKLPRFLQKCVLAFKDDRRYRNDARFVQVCVVLVVSSAPSS